MAPFNEKMCAQFFIIIKLINYSSEIMSSKVDLLHESQFQELETASIKLITYR
jgi:predicted nucleotidyltransferase